MTPQHDQGRRPRRVAEPVQVYLTNSEMARLERLTEQMGANKSDVIRRGLEALEEQLTQPDAHPAIRRIGLVDAESLTSDSWDAAREHDRVLADDEQASWDSARSEG